jgi:hypothetical protein
LGGAQFATEAVKAKSQVREGIIPPSVLSEVIDAASSVPPGAIEENPLIPEKVASEALAIIEEASAGPGITKFLR